MSEVTHTPGPWSYFHDSCTQCESEGKAEYIVMGPPDGHHGQFSNEADARLIAAAPDLLEACDAALHWITDIDNANRTVKQLRAAISKATGAQ